MTDLESYPAMQILFNGWFWHHEETGSGQYVRRLTMALARLQPKCEFVVLIPDEVGDNTPTPCHNLNILSLPVSRHNIAKVWWEQITVPKMARKLGVDLLHIPYWASPLKSTVPAVVTVHDLIPLLLPAYRGGFLVRLYTALVRATATRAALLITDSEASRQDIVRHLRVPPRRVRPVHLAVDEVYRPAPAQDDAAVLQGLGVQPGYVLYLGGFDVRKNVNAIFQAFAQVRHRVDDAHLVIGGKLPQKDTAFIPDPRQQAREAGLAETEAQFVDFVPESAKPALYRGARAFLFPSTYEGFGLPPLEALSCGTPVIASNTSSLPEVIGDAGVLTSPTDVAGIAYALAKLLTDDAFYDELHQRALRQAHRFSWESVAQMTFEAYHATMIRNS